MDIQQKPTRKLALKKKTISKLSQPQMNSNGGDSWTTIYISGACMTDITRVISSIRITG